MNLYYGNGKKFLKKFQKKTIDKPIQKWYNKYRK